MTTEWSQLHSTDVNKAFQEFQNKLHYCLDKIAPIKRQIIPSHKIWHEPWITKGLARSMDKCQQLYKITPRKHHTPHDEIKYKNYRNRLTKIKRNVKTEYYNRCCYTLKYNIKQLWKLINGIINKTNDKSNAIDCIKVNKLDYYKAKEVPNHFGQFYSELGANLANRINNKNLNISKYLSKIPRNQHTIF